MTQQHHLKGVLLASVACILWGISGVAASTLFQLNPHMTALWLTQVRMIIAGIILIIMGQLTGAKPFRIWRHRRDSIQLVSYGLLGLVPVQLCYFEAVRFGNAPIATIIQFLGPFIISIYFFLFKHVTPRRSEAVGMLMAFIGTLLIVTHGHLGSLAISPVVLFWGGLSAIGVATNTLIPRRILTKYGAQTVTGWGLLVAGICLNVFQPLWQVHVSLTGSAISLLVVIIILGTVCPFLMFANSLSYILPTTASLMDAFEPLAATIFSIAFLNVQLTSFDLIGGLLIILAVMALSLNVRKMMGFLHRRTE
ncbi:DMT family transporter [Lactiplantibacillus mudanjiangensis]|uniref:Putative transporter ydeD [Lactobacillus brevis KB290] n=1 Tax=Lactiplantibacillus mudanjiangensis TaxID=1296538 RepID=A0A660E2L5_9LACO|nr:EamA family transporter [Lactiplantibacillus mudanjiangensis]VDG19100.1 putative transporter ydeD [Lactobacillus brevis KB290] [Lactiplantibacillus mudanjiangensis]VDG23199.1 putative transporter ydeD [Lactobacillus brevis KB290] [Lactiplantibacillus mudanjiangensis]VDG29875.1 putative transporter ydeD [Lactobacillus brevis KB290] [Lactiplantibacillus mudanjiangensis]VDG33173.1 putative transporter ydeD [Lactobacillus brevis KB290] [Lactiplantibacillus mudanjiangensis]